MTPEQLARKACALRDQETFQHVISEIRDAQTRVFLNASADESALVEARTVVCGLAAIDRKIQAIIDDGLRSVKKQKGQHRGSD